jgi:formylmethanofuran dehydrogenase subunit A
MSLIRISGGHVIDPANAVDDVRDIWIRDGQVITAPTDSSTRADRTLDARGYAVMPGGVDVHCHIAGPKVSAARIFRPEDHRDALPLARTPGTRSGTLGSVPSTFATGYKYAGLGYTTAVDAAVPPLGARQALFELRDTPVIDKAFLVLLGNNHYVMDRIREGNREGLRHYVAWLLGATRGYGIKVVDPGGVEAWKQNKHIPSDLDERIDHFDVSPREILVEIARAVDELGLPHPVHCHGLNLGRPGNAATTLETMRALDGHRAHMAHIQFHSYGGDPADPASMESHVPLLAEYFNTHEKLTLDVGQVLFGETTSMTADGPVGQFLHRVTGRKWISHDVEQETGCGIVPITYRDKNLVHGLQWAIGLEWFLRVEDPWRVALSTDHPNGGSFLAYPQIIALLMDRGLREEALSRLPARVRERTGLGDLSREYTLSEIAIITRAGPARMLGISHKGHLGPGADGDIAMYQPDKDKSRMFALPRYVLKAGEVVIDDGELRNPAEGAALSVAPGYDEAVVPSIREWFSQSYSFQFANFPIAPDDSVSMSREAQT